jgi:hypothetical protein
MFETPGAETVGIVDRERGDGVKSTHGEGGETAGDAVDGVDEEVTAAEVIEIDGLHVLRRRFEGGVSDDLSDERRREASLTPFEEALAEVGVAGDESADADAAERIALGEGVDEDDIVINALQVKGGGVGEIGVTELAVDLVGEKEEVVPSDEVA